VSPKHLSHWMIRLRSLWVLGLHCAELTSRCLGSGILPTRIIVVARYQQDR